MCLWHITTSMLPMQPGLTADSAVLPLARCFGAAEGAPVVCSQIGPVELMVGRAVCDWTHCHQLLISIVYGHTDSQSTDMSHTAGPVLQVARQVGCPGRLCVRL